MSDRIPPHNLEAEEAVLGAMLVDAQTIATAASMAPAGAFYAPAHAVIAEAIYALDAAGKPVDKISTSNELKARNWYEKAGGISFLSRLMDIGLTSCGNAKYYATLVSEKATLRRLIAAGLKIAKLGYEGEVDVAATIAEAEAALYAATQNSAAASEFISATEASRLMFDELDRAMTSATKPGVSTPFAMLDKHTGRFHPGEVVVVAGAPGMGKSVLSVQLAEHAAWHHGASIIFALEMGNADTFRRIIASKARINVRNMRRGDVTGTEMERIGNVMAQMTDVPMFFSDASKPKYVADIRNICRRVKDRHGLSLIVVDHPGFLADVMTRGKASKHETLELCYQQLKALAAELQIVVVIVQHLNRSGMQREPGLADLRDGGNLEGVAHIAMFPYRADMIGAPSDGELLIAKNRDAEPGRIPMHYEGERFLWRERQTLGGVA